MQERSRNDITDGKSWWCPQCKGRKSIRHGSFFAKSRLPLKKWMLLLHFWLREFPVTTAALDAGIHKSTAIDVYQWFREVCTTTLLNTPIVLGGTGAIVQIDQSDSDGNQLPSYLDEFMWRERYGTTGNQALQSLMTDIAAQYPV